MNLFGTLHICTEMPTRLTGCGMRTCWLSTRVILPAKTANWRGVYLKLRLRGSIDYPLAGVAIAVRANGKIEAARMAVTA